LRFGTFKHILQINNIIPIKNSSQISAGDYHGDVLIWNYLEGIEKGNEKK